MQGFIKKYFDGHDFADKPSPYQERVLAALHNILPELNFDTVLEIGPGKGFGLKLLPKQTKIAISDLTLNTLLNLPYAAIEARLGNMPLIDGAFDLVMAFDVFEHIPDSELPEAIKDVFRIANRYVLLAVPLAEDVIEKTTWCKECGHLFHINHHQRRYLPKDLIGYCPYGWETSAVIYSGTRRPNTHPDTSIIRRQAGEAKKYDRTNCPNCGFDGSFGESATLGAEILDQQEYDAIIKTPLTFDHFRIPSSEIIVLFKKKELPAPCFKAQNIHIIRNNADQFPLTVIRPGIPSIFGDKYIRKMKTKPHYKWPQANFSYENNQLIIKIDPDNPGKINFCYPRNLYKDGKAPIAISVKGHIAGQINLMLTEIGNANREVYAAGLPEGTLDLVIPHELKADPLFGYRYCLECTGNGTVAIIELALSPTSDSALLIASFKANDMILIKDNGIKVYYMSPEPANDHHILPDMLWSDPLMEQETESWRTHLDMLFKRMKPISIQKYYINWLHQKIEKLIVLLGRIFFFNKICKKSASGELAQLSAKQHTKRELPQWLFDRLICPVSKNTLHYEKGSSYLLDSTGKFRFPVYAGIPMLLPEYEGKKIDCLHNQR
jgi:uncharacterized protein YbaR (Trm112 family)